MLFHIQNLKLKKSSESDVQIVTTVKSTVHKNTTTKNCYNSVGAVQNVLVI